MRPLVVERIARVGIDAVEFHPPLLDEVAQGVNQLLIVVLPLGATARGKRDDRTPIVAKDGDPEIALQSGRVPVVMFDMHRG